MLAPAVAEIATVDLRPAELPGLHPGRSAEILVGEDVVGQVGEVDPGVLDAHGIDERVAWLQLDLGLLLSIPAEVPTARPVSRYPSSDIDLAFVVDDAVTARDVHIEILAGAARPDGLLPVEVELFDLFRSDQLGEGRKSLAFRVRFQALDRTLTDAEVADARAAIIAQVETALGATLRG